MTKEVLDKMDKLIKALKSKKNNKVYLYHKNIDKLWKTFLKKFPVVEAAGGLVERTDNIYPETDLATDYDKEVQFSFLRDDLLGAGEYFNKFDKKLLSNHPDFFS